jgi:uncharacterized protein YbaP (TraB family)
MKSRKKMSVTLVLFLAVWSVRAEPAMWVIRDGDSTIYLIGTLHLLRHDTEWNSTRVKKTVAESKALWLEVANLDDQAGTAPIIAKYGFDRERPLSTKLNPAQQAKLARAAERYNIPLPTLEPMQPWMVAVMFMAIPLQTAGYDPNSGVDRLLRAQAAKEGDKIFGFETIEQQVQFFGELPQKDQIALLEETLDDAEKGMELLEKLAKAWLEGDNDTIGKFLVEEMKTKAPALYEKLLVQRNVRWSEKIVEILEGSGVQQIAVGAAHLAGPDSLQAQLAKRGIKVERY